MRFTAQGHRLNETLRPNDTSTEHFLPTPHHGLTKGLLAAEACSCCCLVAKLYLTFLRPRGL